MREANPFGGYLPPARTPSAATARRVLHCIEVCAREGLPAPPARSIRRRTGLSLATIYNATHVLLAAGLIAEIRVERRGRTVARSVFVLPDGSRTA